MLRTITGEKIPIKLWSDDIDEAAMAQLRNLANLPFAFSHIAMMPDGHVGYGMPIGGVLAARDVVIPNAVGVDIGCGMIAVKTSLTNVATGILKGIMGEIRSRIPVGFKHNKHSNTKDMPEREQKLSSVIDQEYASACKQIGTLGGGNHFIEVQKGSCGHIWIMVHSGSRNIGYKVAAHHNRIAKKLNTDKGDAAFVKADLAHLPLSSREGESYLKDMNYCLEFALANRKVMMDRIKEVFSHTSSCEFKDEVNIHHNYAALEEHFGKRVMVHRKGATSAKKGEMGIIPGSQGAKSYIVRGLGNPESFNSCSHGAGRKLGRKQACRELNLATELAKLEKQGILHSIRSNRDLDEAMGAYKDIATVMKNQADLVEIVAELTPLGVIKG